MVGGEERMVGGRCVKLEVHMELVCEKPLERMGDCGQGGGFCSG